MDCTPNPKSREQSMICGEHYRFTVLTPCLLRMEYSPCDVFEDRPTQTVVDRYFDTPAFTLRESDARLEIHTEFFSLSYDKQPFSPNGLYIKNRSACKGIYCTWRYGDILNENLGGTARTIDEADGAVALDMGVLSRVQGYAVLDDSASLALTEDGLVEKRQPEAKDLYFFGYGYRYHECLDDYFHLCGKTPLLPRYALGNWWSRFYAYSDEEYLVLMDRFAKEKVPLAVSVLDMDWHITKVDPKLGRGWTGYTWNRELFPNPEAFLKELHRRGLKITLNLHPAEGVQPHEEMYAPMAHALGRDAQRQQSIAFDVGDRKFWEAYFKYLHHPHEAIGIDFWWIDWQQGKTSAVYGMDPLWMLNHFHFQDIARNGKRPLIFSRYAGPGSHRYPIGFSGDSVISWSTLAFQPYFTATAANIGYGWWSHDIGGHTHGNRDDELAVRWLQFGVFSPIMRLHSTSNLFNGKEPWRFQPNACAIMGAFLRLRHRLIPYLYTMNWRCHAHNELLVRPMYHLYPEAEEAYSVPNQYFFGSELLVCPITEPMNRQTMRSMVKAWLPEGRYTDVMNGLRYQGGRKVCFYRSLSEMPILARAGAIYPLTNQEEAVQNGVALPKAMDVFVYAGANGQFELLEDDGETMAYECGETAATRMKWEESKEGKSCFMLEAPQKQKLFLPPKRRYTLHLVGVKDCEQITASKSDGTALPYTKHYDSALHAIVVALEELPIAQSFRILFPMPLQCAANDAEARVYALLNDAQTDYEQKEQIYFAATQKGGLARKMSQLQALGIAPELLGAVMEILLAEY